MDPFGLGSVPEHLLLRGASLRNTAWVLGVVVHTGRDTKEMQNAQLAVQFKRSRLERRMNIIIIGMLVAQFLCSAVAAAANSAAARAQDGAHWYLTRCDADDDADEAVGRCVADASYSGRVASRAVFCASSHTGFCSSFPHPHGDATLMVMMAVGGRCKPRM